MSETLRVTFHDGDWHPKYYGVIVGLFCGLYMIATALGPKMVEFGPFIVTASIITFPICCIITDILTEIYGFNRTRQAIWTVLVCSLFFSLAAEVAIALPPASFWKDQEAYKIVFTSTPRMALAGCLAWVVGEFLNSYVMSKMKIFQKAERPAVRFIGSTIVAQFADSLIFMIVAFAGTMPLISLITAILTSWSFKILYEVMALPLSLWVARQVKKMEGIEHFDKQELSLI